jgi:HemY protein
MKGLLWLLAAFVLAVALSLAMRGYEGYALFVLPPWRVEVSLILLSIILVAAFAGGYFLVRVAWRTLRFPSQILAIREHRREKKGTAAVHGAIQALFEGRFARAEKLASEARDLSAAPALASLVAARAAQRLREFARRDQWLERAADGGNEWRLARLMTNAELLLDERNFESARAVVRELHAGGPTHIASLMLLLRAEQGLGNWDEVIRIAGLLEKRAALLPEAAEKIRDNARAALLSRKAQDPGSLAQVWREIPKIERTHPKVAGAAARACMQLGDYPAAQRAIEAALAEDWDGELVLLYGECGKEDIPQRIARAERWLRERPADAALLLTLGRLCFQRELWGKAQSYLEASLAAQPTQAAHVTLATLFDRIGRAEDANRHFRASADAGLSG